MKQLIEEIKDCNGCEACVVGCKYRCVKMVENEEGLKRPDINMDGCIKCNACKMFCPLFIPVTMPEFKTWYAFDEQYMNREMATIYRETMRSVRSGSYTEFVGTLCQIAALKSLMGDKFRPNLKVYPLECTDETRKKLGCKNCKFY